MVKKSPKPTLQLPKDALQRIQIGASFAEYDLIRDAPALFENTPSTQVAIEYGTRAKCFFVGRRGTGKTALTYFIKSKFKNAIDIHPLVMSPLGVKLAADEFRDTRQRPFKTLVACFKRAMLAEVLLNWIESRAIKESIVSKQSLKEINSDGRRDYDLRLLEFFNTAWEALTTQDEDTWLREIKREKSLLKEMKTLASGTDMNYTILIDRIDESWDGTDEAVIFLMALMHACVELTTSTAFARPLLFLRENIFDRVRKIDNEFARLETWVVSLEWSAPLLVEMIERRLNHPFTTKLPLGGQTWDYFFEPIDGKSSRQFVFEICHERPRDVLTFCEFALQAARTANHQKITVEDVQAARRRFSESRLKDLGDEYSENYPHIEIVLDSFFGLGWEFTLAGFAAFMGKLLGDKAIFSPCRSWLFDYTAPERFIELLWNIGFLGIGDTSEVKYRAPGANDSSHPRIASSSRFVIHGTYRIALNLQDVIVGGIDENFALRKGGLLYEFPEGIGDVDEYNGRLSEVMENLQALPCGDGADSEFEDVVGNIIKLCFYRWLGNCEPHARNVTGRVVRDWICANIAPDGFWEAIRHRYNAMNVIWECKNCADLRSEDFQQVNYYLTQPIGGCSVVAFRGEKKKAHYEHIMRIAHAREGKGIVLLVNERDLIVFLRQALSGKTRDSHIRAIYDDTIKAIS